MLIPMMTTMVLLTPEDAFPLDADESADTDGDGIGNNADAFPLDDTESVDTDGDGIGNNADTDDDNDGVIDSEDACPLLSQPTPICLRKTLVFVHSIL